MEGNAGGSPTWVNLTRLHLESNGLGNGCITRDYLSTGAAKQKLKSQETNDRQHNRVRMNSQEISHYYCSAIIIPTTLQV